MNKNLLENKINTKITSLTSNNQGGGSLIIVGTPIGNILDFSQRAKATLGEVDYILAEDTRKVRKLAMLTGFTYKKIIRYHENKNLKQVQKFVSLILDGSNVALVSDAGMPLISDPGYKLVYECIKANIEVKTVPGPSSIISSLVVSGLPTNSFYFVGFLPKKVGARRSLYSNLNKLNTTIILMESPKRLLSLLEELNLFFGNLEIAVVREQTKLYEEVIRGKVLEVLKKLEKRSKIIGEIIVILYTSLEENKDILSPEIINEIQKLSQKHPIKTVVNKIVYKTGKPRNIIYKEALKIKKINYNKK